MLIAWPGICAIDSHDQSADAALERLQYISTAGNPAAYREEVDRLLTDSPAGEDWRCLLIAALFYQSYVETVDSLDLPALLGASNAYRSCGELDALGRSFRKIESGMERLNYQLFFAGVAHYQQRHFDEAYALFDAVSRNQEFLWDNFETWQELDTSAILLAGYSAYNAQRSEEARVKLEQMLSFGTRDDDAIRMLANIYLKDQAYAKYYALLEYRIEIGKLDRAEILSVRKALCAYYLEMDDRNSARKHLRKADKLAPDDPELLILRQRLEEEVEKDSGRK